jgi:hypothetical protein
MVNVKLVLSGDVMVRTGLNWLRIGADGCF